MKLTHACGYAIHAVVYLARQKDDLLVASRQIAEAQGLPERFLVKVLKPLVSAQVLMSLRGPNGGYRLARAPRTITLLDIVEAVDGPIRGQVPIINGAKGSDDKLTKRLETVCSNTADLVRLRLQKVKISDLVAKG
jgi:Rrf2 family protein